MQNTYFMPKIIYFQLCQGPFRRSTLGYFNYHFGKENDIVSVMDCPLYSVEITVGTQPDEFMRRQASTCYQLGVLPPVETKLICVQSLSGRYVTIEERSDADTPCMSLCDVTIYEGGYTVSYLP